MTLFVIFQLIFFSLPFHKGRFVSFYPLESFSFYILCFVILCCFSDIYVAFLFFGWLLQLLEKKHLRHLNFTSLHSPHNAAFFTLLLSVLFPTVQIYVDMKEILFGGQFKYRYRDTGI